MKNYSKYIPLTAFAAAIVLGGSLRAEETASEGTGTRDQQSQRPGRTADETGTVPTPDQANSGPMSASEVLGMNIDSADNEKIGEIDEIFVNSDTGEVLALVVSTGGLLGMGQQQSLISPKDLRINTERTLMQTNISKEQIRNAPRYEEGQTSGLDQVRPLGQTPSDGEARTERTNRRESGQSASDRRAAGEERTARADRSEGEQHASNRLRTAEEPTEGEQHASNRLRTGEERTERTNRSESGQSAFDRQAAGEERTERTNRRDTGQSASDRQAAGEERMGRTNRSEGEQSEGHALAVSELIEMSVENRQGEVVGDVNEAFLDLEKWEVAGVVVSTGGFLGIGDRKTLFGLQEMSFDATNEKVLLDYDRDQISAFPEFKPDDQSVFEELRERIDSLHSNSTRSAAVQQ